MFGWFKKQKPKAPSVNEIIDARKARLDQRRAAHNAPRTVEANSVGEALDLVAGSFARPSDSAPPPHHTDRHATTVYGDHHYNTVSHSHSDHSASDFSSSSSYDGGAGGGDSGGGSGGGGAD